MSRTIKYFAIAALFTSVLATFLACGATLPSTASEADKADAERSITVDGIPRTYTLHIPTEHPKLSAVVIVFHGGGGKGATMRGITGMNNVSDQHGFIAVYPQGLGSVWNDGGSDLTDGKTPRDDVSFVRHMIDDIATQVPIDKKKVFACGFSNGGSMTARLTLEAHDTIAGAALVGSGYYEKQMATFKHPAPMPVLFIHGTDDPCHPYNGGMTTGPKFGATFRAEHHGTVISANEAVSFWRKVDGCTGEAETGAVPHITKDDTSTTFERWKGKDGNDVAIMTVKGGGHCWPGGAQYFPVNVIGKTTYDFSASQAIWRFFANHGGS